MVLDILGGGGSGKTTLKFALLESEAFSGFVPYTTRPKRPEEIDGVHYHFISVERFHEMDDSFVLKRTADSWLYGVLKQDLQSRTDRKVVVATFDASGIRKLEEMGTTVKVVYLNIPESERRRRMLNRGDDHETVLRRLALDQVQFQDFDFCSPVLEIRGGSIDEIVSMVVNFVG